MRASSQHAVDSYSNPIKAVHGNPYDNPLPHTAQKRPTTSIRKNAIGRSGYRTIRDVLANDIYPRDKRQRTRFVINCIPIMVQLTKYKRYENVNGIEVYCYHTAKNHANGMPNPGLLTDVNMYIEDCKKDGMTQGER